MIQKKLWNVCKKESTHKNPSSCIRSLLAGVLLAVVSVSSARAASPGLDSGTGAGSAYSQEMADAADEIDLEILTPYMDSEILAKVMKKESEPAEIISAYAGEDASFNKILHEYFVKPEF